MINTSYIPSKPSSSEFPKLLISPDERVIMFCETQFVDCGTYYSRGVIVHSKDNNWQLGKYYDRQAISHWKSFYGKVVIEC